MEFLEAIREKNIGRTTTTAKLNKNCCCFKVHTTTKLHARQNLSCCNLMWRLIIYPFWHENSCQFQTSSRSMGWSVLIFATVHGSSVSYNLFCAVNPHDVADVVAAAAWCFWIAMPSKLKYCCIVTLPDMHQFETVHPETGQN